MKHFRTIEKRYPGMFSWPFSRPLSSTLDRYSVQLIADAQAFQQAGASVRQARQGFCSLCCESETVLLHDRREPSLLLRNKGCLFLKQGHYRLFIYFFPHSLIVPS